MERNYSPIVMMKRESPQIGEYSLIERIIFSPCSNDDHSTNWIDEISTIFRVDLEFTHSNGEIFTSSIEERSFNQIQLCGAVEKKNIPPL